MGLLPSSWFAKPPGTDPLPVAMTGVKLGNRVLIVGDAGAGFIAALAVKAGLTGRTCTVQSSAEVRDRTAVAVEREGALIEAFAAPFNALPFEAGSFDVVVLRSALSGAGGSVALEAARVLRPGGRCVVIDDAPSRGGLAALFGRRGPSTPPPDAVPLLSAAGFRGVRTLAEAEGFVFAEGVKPGV